MTRHGLIVLAAIAALAVFGMQGCESKDGGEAEKSAEGEGEEAEGEGAEGEGEGAEGEGEAAGGEGAEGDGEGEGEAADGEGETAEAEPEAPAIDWSTLQAKKDDAGNWGYYDADGNVVVALDALASVGEVQGLGDFAHERAFVAMRVEGQDVQGWMMIDTEGKPLLESATLTSAGRSDPAGRVWVAHSHMGTPDASDDKWGLINAEGEWVSKPKWDLIARPNDEAQPAIPVSTGNFWGWLDYDGSELLPAIYDKINSTDDGVAILRKDGKVGLYFVESKAVVAPLADDCWVKDGNPMCDTGGNTVTYDMQGKPTGG